MNYLAYSFLADVEDAGKLWFWIIFGAVILIKNIIAHFSGKNEQDATNADDERRQNEERRVRELIEGMKKTPPVNPIPSPGNPSLPPSAEGTAKRLTTQTAPAPAQRPQPPQRQWQASTPNPAQTLEFYTQAAERAKQSVNTLSDAERAALQRLYGPSAPRKQAAALPAAPAGGSLKHGLRNSQALRAAILYREILGPPKALQ